MFKNFRMLKHYLCHERQKDFRIKTDNDFNIYRELLLPMEKTAYSSLFTNHIFTKQLCFGNRVQIKGNGKGNGESREDLCPVGV